MEMSGTEWLVLAAIVFALWSFLYLLYRFTR
jgi:hypothetical protein